MGKNKDAKFEMREKKRWYVLLSVSLFSFCIFLIIYFPNEVKIDKKLMTIIVSIDENSQKIIAYISEEGKNHIKKEIQFNPKNTYDLSSIIALIKNYESNNWKTINSTMEVPTAKGENKSIFYFFMQKDVKVKP